jgi:tRNA threonylcarbamoyladenosine biosynthesis protein TsaB
VVSFFVRESAMGAGGEPRLLLLETSGRVGQVALARGDSVLDSRRLDEARRRARDLAPAVAALLAAQGWRPRDLDGVIVSRGPGSYTGLRVGVMSAKALAYATGCALLGVETFAAIALQVPPEVGVVDVVADAQQGRVYVQRFVRAAPDGPLVITEFTQRFDEPRADTWVAGPGLRVYGPRLAEGWRVVPQEDWEPRPESLLRLGLARFLAGERDDVWALEPLYLRPSAAEEQWDRKRE